MNILTSNTATTRKYTIELQESLDKWKAKRQDIRDKIAETATMQARLMLSEENDIGNPAQLCEELSKLRLEYTEITVQEKEEKERIMKTYMEEVMINMGNPELNTDDAIKLRVYDKYIQSELTTWDVDKRAVIWPNQNWTFQHHAQHTTGPIWLKNFRHTINTKIQEERAKVKSK